MGALGGLLGLGGGQSGTGIDPAQQADIQRPVGVPQLDTAYGQSQGALQKQQDFLQALESLGGTQHQQQVYGQMQDVAAGRGPNPAQAMLNQQTGANIASQAALMAGQRGSNANTGLMARQIAQQGAATQQQAVGQGATLQAQQSLNALNQAGGIANQQVANQLAATQGFTGAMQAQYGNLANALGAQNQAGVSSQSSVNAANAGLANTQLQGQQGMIGAGINALGGAAKMGAGGAAHGGMIGMADGGMAGPQSSLGQFLTSVKQPGSSPVEIPQFSASNPGADAIRSAGKGLRPGGSMAQDPSAIARPTGAGGMMSGAAMKSGGMVPVALSPGEKVVPPEKVQQAAQGSVVSSVVPGKANVAGDSSKNDTFKTQLPPGSVVIPRTKAKDDKDAAAFVRAVLAKRGRK